jgi:hypothetical protein
MINDAVGEESLDFCNAIADARLMVTALHKGGANQFDVTLKDISGENVKFRRRISVDSFRRRLEGLLEEAEQRTLSIIIRPHAPDTIFIQLDDLTPENAAMMEPYSCCLIETSPNNLQAFIALTGMNGKAEADAVRRSLIKSAHADEGASGAARIAGSLNVKEKHRRADGSFPRVRLMNVKHGLILTPSELSAKGFLQDLSVPTLRPVPSTLKKRRRRAPVYALAVNAVRTKEDGEVDRSAVDFHYAVVCFDWGFSYEDTVRLLRANSPKAAERDDDYAERTVSNALRQYEARRATRPKLSLLKK